LLLQDLLALGVGGGDGLQKLVNNRNTLGDLAGRQRIQECVRPKVLVAIGNMKVLGTGSARIGRGAQFIFASTQVGCESNPDLNLPECPCHFWVVAKE
jgi:chromosome condensin MukBEF MukE localization factor